MYKKRHVQERLKLLAKNFKVVLVLGPRQVGKTTLLRATFPNLPYVSFEIPDQISQARQDPGVFIDTYRGPVIFDEVQFVPQLLNRIKAIVDQSEEKGQYFLTGSQNLSTLRGVSESMAGRVGILDLTGMSVYEHNELFSFNDKGQESPVNWLQRYLANPSKDDLVPAFGGVASQKPLVETIWRGGLPALNNLDTSLFTDYFNAYLRTYIERDIRTFGFISDLVPFEMFVRLVGALSGHEINYSHLGREIGIEQRTAKAWIGLLLQGYLWYDVRPYTRNAVKAVAKRGKGYFFDTGMAAYLQQIRSPQAVLSHPNFGSLFETYCFNMLRQLSGSSGMKPGIYYWRTVQKTEVDFILEMDGKLYPIEVKAKSRPNGYDARGIKAFQHAYPEQAQLGIILHAGTECYLVADRVLCLPYNAVMRD